MGPSSRTLNTVGWSATWHPDRPLSKEEIARAETGLGAHVRLIPGTFETLANKSNDYLIDREKQRTETLASGDSGRLIPSWW